MTAQEPARARPGESAGTAGAADEHAARFEATRPVAATRPGFSAAALTAAAAAVAVLAVAVWTILVVLDQPGPGLVLAAPVLGCAAVLGVLAARRRRRDQATAGLAGSMTEPIGVPDTTYLEVDARRWKGGWVGIPHLLNVRYPTVVDDAAPGWAEAVARAVHAHLGEQYVVARHNARDGRLTLRDPSRSPGPLSTQPEPEATPDPEPARRTTEKIHRPPPPGDQRPGRPVALGVNASGAQVTWDPGGSHGSLLVLGRSGSGKRVLLTGVALEAAVRGWPVWIIDHRRVDLHGLRDWPNVQIVASTLDDQIVVLEHAWREMESRVELVESGTSPADLEPLVVMVHHFREFATAVAEAAARADQSAAGAALASDRVTQLLRHGGQVNVVVVLSVQRADDPLLREQHRDDLGTVVALGRLDAPASSVLWRGADADESAEPVPGRGVVRVGDGTAATVQCYWTPDPREARRIGDEQDLRLIEAFRPHVVTHPVLHVQRPRARSDSPAATWRATLSGELTEGYASAASGLVDWGRARRTEQSDDTAGAGRDAGGWSEIVMVSQLEPGNLARIDDDTGWVVVEQVDAVENDGTRLRIQWRGSDGAGTAEVSRTRTVRIRHLSDGVY
ncbi:hypothetical protein CLV30_11493 [Haloactinopolyspora alba]|uniref:FtsK domain-containing protein n=1 Tax=Haloactinopolyspora alba TaxID=648780 RepID=A0A2P8DVV2_9ACTN|nr:hypothetical protein [Haloactinopolyspora alba]PSL01363.1 hypothetical protein CLV30_11493 [Haloactinopolyspora alba]